MKFDFFLIIIKCIYISFFYEVFIGECIFLYLFIFIGGGVLVDFFVFFYISIKYGFNLSLCFFVNYILVWVDSFCKLN